MLFVKTAILLNGRNMAVYSEVPDEGMKYCRGPDHIIGPGCRIKERVKIMIGRPMQAEPADLTRR